MFSRLRAFDVYPKTLDEFKEKTFSGATISVLSIISIVILIVSEVHYFYAIDRVDELYVDTLPEGKLQIYLNITFPHVACSALHLDTMDGFGESQLNVEKDIYKVRLDQEGTILSVQQDMGHDHDHDEGEEHHKEEGKGLAEAVMKAAAAAAAASKAVSTQAVDPNYCGPCYGAEQTPTQCCNTCDEVKEAYRKRGWAMNINGQGIEQCVRENQAREKDAVSDEGCNIYGFLKVNKVQGNFHFAPGKSFHHAGTHIHDFLPFELEHFNVSHIIHRLGFGADYPGIVNPLDNRQHILSSTMSGLYQYFIKVVPTLYEKYSGEVLHTNQYSVTEHFKARPLTGEQADRSNMPGVFFIYDLSPIMVHIRETKRHRSTLHFLTNLCSIVGGVFTVAGIIDRLFYHSWRSIKKKMQMGKGS